MEIQHLRYFYAVAQSGSFSGAGRILRIAQPVVSRYVKLLEEELGGELFLRRPRTTVLTPLGTEIYRHCDTIFSEFHKVVERRPKADRSPNVAGKIGLGLAEGIARGILPHVLSKAARLYPELYYWNVVAPSSTLCAMVKAKEIEMAWLYQVPRLTEELSVCAKFDVEYHMVVSRKHFNKRSVLKNFIGSREVDDPTVTSYPALKRLQKRVPEARISISINSFSAQKELVLAGQGVAILPRYLVKGELEKGMLQRVFPKERFIFPLKVVVRNREDLSPAAKALLSLLPEALGL